MTPSSRYGLAHGSLTTCFDTEMYLHGSGFLIQSKVMLFQIIKANIGHLGFMGQLLAMFVVHGRSMSTLGTKDS